ncbi:hypothetical protein PybrP1_001878 [[Pythium] brassicae (nom. inval.)]|nr:hypothetical protein PybrP1_001878 [[Pythium] brassicae (nom. inval.)]
MPIRSSTKEDVERDEHEVDWRWLRDPNHPELRRFLETLAQPRFRKTERALYLELRRRLVREDATIPERIGSFEYFMRQSAGENYQVYCRRHRATGREEANEHEQCRAFVKDLHSQRLVPLGDDLVGVRNAEWGSAPGRRCFYYTRVDAHRRPCAVYRYDCDAQTQELVYAEPDDSFFVDVSQTKDGRFVLINCNSKTTSEIHALASDDARAAPRLLRAREPGTAYFADHAGDRFFIVTNADDAANYKIVTASSATCDVPDVPASSGQWTRFLPEAPDVKIEDVDLFRDFLVLYERVASVPRIRVCALAPGASPASPSSSSSSSSSPEISSHVVPLPPEHAICRISPGVNRDFAAQSVRFSVSTPLVPEIVYDYDMGSRALQVLKEVPVESAQAAAPAPPRHHTSASQRHAPPPPRQTQRTPTRMPTRTPTRTQQFDPALYTCERVLVPSRTSLGVDVPLTLVHRRGLARDGQNPTLLLGYGAYGTNLEADFELEHLSLLERGWVVALAHARGGGELGLRWHHAGRGLRKRNTFDDYLSCALHLLDTQVTRPERLAGKGASAGGLVMGVMANEHPALFRALVLKVPFLDILATMRDPSLPLTVHEYEEWGDPRDPTIGDYIRSYAPCENLRAGQAYPSMLVTGGMHDQRVQFWEPVKWVYKLRQLRAAQKSTNQQLLLLKMSEDDGHFGGGGRLEQLQESAMEMAFLYKVLDLPFSDI